MKQRHRLRVAVDEVEQAMSTRVGPGDEVRPGDGTLGRIARLERRHRARLDQAGDVRELALREKRPH